MCIYSNKLQSNDPVMQRFSTFLVLQPLDHISKVVATPNNKIDWVTPLHRIFVTIMIHFSPFDNPYMYLAW